MNSPFMVSRRTTITDTCRHIRSRGTWDKREIWSDREGNSNDLSNTWRKQGPWFSTSQFSQYENQKTRKLDDRTEITDDSSKGYHGHR